VKPANLTPAQSFISTPVSARRATRSLPNSETGDVWIEVAALAGEPNAIALNPQTLTRDEAGVVAARLRQVLTS
jgi:hypothetical protein